MGVAKDCERVVKEASEKLGGLDVLISNAVSVKGPCIVPLADQVSPQGWTKFAPMDDLDTLTEEDWDKV
jgi:NAD(P)-dependent dehydrogenase (short-subunit alcohol dehydrogenase family)